MEKIKLPLIFGIILIAAGFLVGPRLFEISGPETKTSQSTGSAVVEAEVAVNPSDPIRGNPEAKVTIVEFSDYQCPFCGIVEPTLRKILETYGDKVRLIYKNYPLPSHENAEGAALASLCAKEQGKYWEYHDKLFENQDSLKTDDLKKYAADLGLKTEDFNSCLEGKKYKSQIEVDVMEANQLGVRSTPTFFINGRLLVGAAPFENFKAVIEEELKR